MEGIPAVGYFYATNGFSGIPLRPDRSSGESPGRVAVGSPSCPLIPDKFGFSPDFSNSSFYARLDFGIFYAKGLEEVHLAIPTTRNPLNIHPKCLVAGYR